MTNFSECLGIFVKNELIFTRWLPILQPGKRKYLKLQNEVTTLTQFWFKILQEKQFTCESYYSTQSHELGFKWYSRSLSSDISYGPTYYGLRSHTCRLLHVFGSIKQQLASGHTELGNTCIILLESTFDWRVWTNTERTWRTKHQEFVHQAGSWGHTGLLYFSHWMEGCFFSNCVIRNLPQYCHCSKRFPISRNEPIFINRLLE